MRVLSQHWPEGPQVLDRGTVHLGVDGARRNLAEGSEPLPPGVEVDWVHGGSQVSTTVRRLEDAGFVGLAERGPLDTPVLVRDSGELTATFGDFVPWAFLAYAASAFFENGGRDLWLVRVADQHTVRRARLMLRIAGRDLDLVATSEGTWGDGIFAQVAPVADDSFDLVLWLVGTDQIETWPGLPYDADRVARMLNGQERAHGRVRQPSQLVEAMPCSATSVPPGVDRGRPMRGHPHRRRRRRRHGPLDADRPDHGWLSGGHDGLATLDVGDFRRGLESLEAVSSISILAMPDIVRGPRAVPRRPRRPCRDQWVPGTGRGPRLVSLCRDGRPVVPAGGPGLRPGAKTPSALDHLPPDPRPPVLDPAEIEQLQIEMIEQCARTRNRIALIDPPPNLVTPADTAGWADALRRRLAPDTQAPSFAGFYAPWIAMPDPLYPTARSEGRDLVVPVPPSGHVAGAMAAIDRRLGPAKPPANIALAAARALSGAPRPADRGALNQTGVNLILPMASRGLRIFGARTLSQYLPWCFLNVRRLMIFVETNLERILLPLVFENQNPLLWETVERLVGGFLDQLWQKGWLAGSSPEEAYSVRCDGTTNPPDQVEVGRMVVLVSVTTPWPVENITVLFGVTEAGLTVLTDVETHRGWP